MAVDTRRRTGLYGPANLTDAQRVLITPGAVTASETSSTGFTRSAATFSAGGSGASAPAPSWLNPQHKPAWLDPTVERLAHLLGLAADWDSCGAQAVDPEKADLALNTLLAVMNAESPPPAIVPTSNGGIQLEWHRSGIDLEIEPVSFNRIEFYTRTPDGDEREGAWAYDLTDLRNLIRQLGNA